MSEQAMLLVADDDPAVRQSLERTLTREGYGVVLAPDGQAALDRLRQGGIDLLLSDLKMPGLTGLELLKQAREAAPDVDVILLTAFGTVEEAVRAMKDGAIDFLTKPLQRAQLVRVIRQALERRSLIQQNRALKERLDDLLREGNAIGVSYAFKQMMTLVGQVADSSASVLIQGESGTGKELAARAIHDRSPRRQGPFVAVNCAALPETLLESELFGYEKGAFTGAGNRKEGRFELADGGTLFLDEVADLSPVTQPKILRVLQEGEFERVGGTRTLRVDVRIVTATNQDLTQLVRDKRFREDLFYRLNVITITTPPLRDRREDIPVLARGTAIEVENLPANVTERSVMFKRDELESGPGVSGDTPGGVFTIRVGTPLAEVEQRLLEETLRMNKGNRSLTAKQLGIDPKTVFRKLKQAEAEAEESAADADKPSTP